MASTFTVSIRSLVAGAAAISAVVAAYLVGSADSDGSPAFAAEDTAAPTDRATIAMTGSGEATGVPDQLTFGITIKKNAADVSTALNSANRVTRHVLQAVRDQGLDMEDVQTTGLSIHPNHDYSDDGPAVIIGYGVSQELSVLVRSLPDAGSTISAAVEAGGNAVRLHDVRLQIGDKEGMFRRARDAAFAEARAKAEQYAEATGQELGEVTSVREVKTKSSVPVAYEARDLTAASALSDVPIKAGTAELDVTVSVVWSFA